MKPVAWIDPYDLERLPHHDCWVNGQEHKNSVPLYAHSTEELTTMLRQLQAENNALRKTVDSLFAGLDSSLALNKAQAERAQEK